MNVAARNTSRPQTKIETLAARFMQAFNDHDAATALSLMVPEPVWEFAVGAEPWGVIHQGRDAVKKAMDLTFQKNPDISYKTLRVYGSDDSVIYEVLTESPMNNLKVQSVDIMTFDANDKIAFKRTYRKVVMK
jgi:ketosteroid isomerase-like protein